MHVPPAHTDGDLIVWWRHANVVHMGDTYFHVKAAKPSAEFDATWGTGFIKPDLFMEILYTDLSKK